MLLETVLEVHAFSRTSRGMGSLFTVLCSVSLFLLFGRFGGGHVVLDETSLVQVCLEVAEEVHALSPAVEAKAAAAVPDDATEDGWIAAGVEPVPAAAFGRLFELLELETLPSEQLLSVSTF